jgi:hypothetical protein
MENYHRRPKATKAKFEDHEDSGSGSAGVSDTKISTQEHNRPQQHGVMVISPHGKIRTYVTRALEILTEADNDNGTQQESVESEQRKTSKTGAPGAKSSSVCVASVPQKRASDQSWEQVESCTTLTGVSSCPSTLSIEHIVRRFHIQISLRIIVNTTLDPWRAHHQSPRSFHHQSSNRG